MDVHGGEQGSNVLIQVLMHPDSLHFKFGPTHTCPLILTTPQPADNMVIFCKHKPFSILLTFLLITIDNLLAD